MKFFRRHWYNIGLAVAVIAAIFLVLQWNSMGILQKVLLLNFIAILVLQFEEYGFPGGEPAIMNIALQNSPTPDRYPLNQNSAMITNVVAGYTMYLIPVFLPDIIWLGLAPILFGMCQFIVHGITTNIKLKSFYNPGLGAVTLLHIPLGIYYIYYIQSNGLASVWDWIIGVVYMLLFAFVIVNKMTRTWLADKNSPYHFAEEEMKRFNVQEKVDKARRKN
ncbi:MAG: HXXEE domain-containing protein [Methanimicrococcus sp.]|nr:HXXEE domain-containing protein [Methanimicrococcus sp.]